MSRSSRCFQGTICLSLNQHETWSEAARSGTKAADDDCTASRRFETPRLITDDGLKAKIRCLLRVVYVLAEQTSFYTWTCSGKVVILHETAIVGPRQAWDIMP